MSARPAVDVEDVEEAAATCRRHRIILNFEGESTNVSTDAVIAEVLDRVSHLEA